MNLTDQQQRLLAQGKPVNVEIDGEECVLLTRRTFEHVKSNYCIAEENGGALESQPRLSDLIGAWRTSPALNDDDIERILEEERIRKYA